MRGHFASRGEDVKQPASLRCLSYLWLAVQVGIWLCGLPIRLRVHNLSELLQRRTPVRGRAPRSDLLELEQAVQIMRRICGLRWFRGRLFPQACLRQALILYHGLTRLGYPVAIHFGVYKVGEVLRGHSWVTFDGVPVAERIPPEALQTIYSCPATLSSGSRT